MFVKKVFYKIIKKLKIDKLAYSIKYILCDKQIVIDEKTAYEELMKLHPMPSSSPITNNEIVSKDYDLTVIIPAYNSEKWIEECLDSVVAQKTSYKYKVKVVNDGSTDNTLSIISKFKNYEFIEIINQENKGYSGARNVALKQIDSEYVMFLDSDDVLEPNSIEWLLNTAYNNKAEIVEGSAEAFNSKGIVYTVKKTDCIDYKGDIWGGPCFKVIDSSLFNNLCFPLNYLYEDTIINYLIVQMARRISTISKSVYRYRIHENSITQKHTNNPNRIDSFWIMLLVHDCMMKLNIKLSLKTYNLTMRHIVMTFRRTILLDEAAKKYIFVLTRRFIIDNYLDYLKTNRMYRNLADSIINLKYDRYCLICKNIKI